MPVKPAPARPEKSPKAPTQLRSTPRVMLQPRTSRADNARRVQIAAGVVI